MCFPSRCSSAENSTVSFKHLALLPLSILPLVDNCTIFICYSLLHWASWISCHSEMTMLYWQINLITFDKLTSLIAYLLLSMHVVCVYAHAVRIYIYLYHTPPVSDKQSKWISPKIYTYMFIGKNCLVFPSFCSWGSGKELKMYQVLKWSATIEPKNDLSMEFISSVRQHGIRNEDPLKNLLILEIGFSHFRCIVYGRKISIFNFFGFGSAIPVTDIILDGEFGKVQKLYPRYSWHH